MEHSNVDRAIALLRQALGDAAVAVDPARRALVAQDVFSATDPVAVVVAPRTTENVLATVRIAAACGLHVVARGGGMSYTSGYLSGQPASAIVLDMSGMDAVREISTEDGYVVVEPGCTWERLHAALSPQGVRAAFWGPLSGLRATVGGSISQNAIFWGSGDAGSAADTLLGLEVVTGNGGVVRTGSFGVTGAKPFFRHFGPDLTGLFTADAGALGIKTALVLRLVPTAVATDVMSFAVTDHCNLVRLLSEVARQGLAAQQMGLDVGLKNVRLAPEGLLADLGHLLRLVRTQPLRSGLRDAWRVARAGREFIDSKAFSAHLFLEGRDAQDVASRAAAIRAIAARIGAVEAEASIPRMMQATPFGPLNGMLGPKGERWVPVHCVVPHSQAAAAYEAIAAVVMQHRPEMERQGITIGYLFTTVGRNGFVIEPMFLWPDALHALHGDALDSTRLARFAKMPDAPGIRTSVASIRAAVSAAVDALGAVHIQLGRYYNYASRLDPDTLNTIAALRWQLDPSGIINPGALR